MRERKSHAAQYLDYMLAAASDRIGRQLSTELQRRGVPLECWRVLSLLSTGEGWSMGELAEGALLSLPTATRIIDKMVSDSLVYRAPHEEDRRKVLIFISDKGLRLWKEVKRSADKHQRAIIAQYGDAWMEELLQKLGHLLDESGDEPRKRRSSA